ncbi:MAG TPA: hypothetical protein VIH21_09685, partial [Dehalococcoidia bacterium]
MNQSRTVYCTSCARPGDISSPYCPNCGIARALTREKRAGHVAFLLNELRDGPITEQVTPQQAADIAIAYETQLRELTAPAPRRAAAAPSAQPRVSPPSSEAVATRARVRTAAARREPYDWSWLAEQQANLFLFAGAFLTVVAALIYVGYSGQAVSGALKMSLLAVYTLAFLIGGAVCMRYPRVATAGQVFFGIGAILVPLNFAAAHSMLTDRDLSRESLWLAGSLVSAMFYFAVAHIGFGRLYAFGSAVATLSATAAFCVVSHMPVEWTAAVFIGVALAMVCADLFGSEVLRARVGSTWSPVAQAAAVAALAFALLLAPFVADAEYSSDITTRWYLPITFGLFALAAAVPMLRTKRGYFGIATLAGASGAVAGIAYAIEAPAEAYAVAIAALAVLLGATSLAVRAPELARRLPDAATDAAYGAGVLAAGAAMLVAVLVMASASNDENATYVIRSRWFLASSFALGLAFFAPMSIARKQPWDAAAAAAAFGGAWLATVWAFEWPMEAYVPAAAALAPLFGLAVIALKDERVSSRFSADAGDIAYGAGAVATVLAGVIAFGVLEAAAGDAPTYAIRTSWFLAPGFALSAAFFVTMAFVRSQRVDVLASVISTVGLSVALVYGFGISAEYYAFALIGTAIVFGVAARWAPQSDPATRLHSDWREDCFLLGRIAAISGCGVAIAAALVAAAETNNYAPDTRTFLPLAFLSAAAFFAIDASRGRRADTSALVFASATAAAVAIPYAFAAGAEYYGLALAGAGIACAVAPQIWCPTWIERRASDAIGVGAVALSTLPFEGVYAHAPHIGAAVHLAAAMLFAAAAIRDDSTTSIGRLTDVRGLDGVRISMGWLYAGGASATMGYLYVLRGAGSEQEIQSGSLALPLMAAAVVFIVSGAVVRRWRREFSPHLYVMSLIVALGSLASVDDTGTLVILLSVYVGAYVAIAVYEDQPFIAAPSVLFGFALIEALRREVDGPHSVIPIACAAVAIAAYALALVVRRDLPRWSLALRGAGALYALAAPVAGFALLASESDGGLVNGAPVADTWLFQVSTLAVALVGLLGLIESALAGRRWMIVPASGALLAALLLQIARFDPQNAQAYSIPVGAYLVLLAVAGLSRGKLIRELEPAAVYIEAIGAATIMLPSFVQSFSGGWYYQLVLVVEAAAFFCAGIALRRRGILTAAIGFIVLV